MANPNLCNYPRVGCIYRITCSVNSKIYIGRTIEPPHKRFYKHFSDAFLKKYDSPMACAIRKYGRSAFTQDLVEWNIPEELLDDRERFWISELKAMLPFGLGYNCTPGGGNNTKWAWTDARRKRKGRKFTEEHRRNIVLAWKTRPPTTEETRQRIRAAAKLRVWSEDHKAKLRRNVLLLNSKKGHPVLATNSETGETKRFSSVRCCSFDLPISYGILCRILAGTRRTAYNPWFIRYE